MRIPINMGVKGRVTATLTNTETGEKQEVKGNNLILNHYLDWAMTQGLGVLGTTTFNRCYIGTGDTPPQPTDTTFNGTQLAVSSSSTLVDSSISPRSKFEVLNVISGLDIGNSQCIAITPDGEMLILAGNSGVKAYEINEVDWSISQLNVADFDLLEGISCRAVTCDNEHLFVALTESPWGKLYKRSGQDFLFIKDLSDLGYGALSADISACGKYLALAGSTTSSSSNPRMAFYDLSEPEIPLLTLFHDFMNSPRYVKFFAYDEVASFAAVGRSTSSSNVYPRMWVFKYNADSNEFEVVDYDAISSSSGAYYGAILPLSDNLMLVVARAGGIYASDQTGFYIKQDGVWSFTRDRDFGTDCEYMALNKNTLMGPNNYVGYQVFPTPKYVYSGQPIFDSQSTLGFSRALHFSGAVFIGLVDEEGTSLGIAQPVDSPNIFHNYARQWTFPAGVGTGTVNRIGLQANSGTGANGNNSHVAQIVIPEPLEKTDLHQLDVIWEIEVENPGVWEGVIPGGSRDGSDLNWRITINEEQFYDLVQTGYRIPANWFGTTGTPNVRIGTSNEESDLIFDRGNIRGEQIQYISSTAIRVVNPYVPGSLKRTIRLFLEVDQGNGQIGEIVFGGSTSDNSLARITFDPPLDKPPDVGEGANPYRIYLDLEIGWQRGESDA